MGGRLKDIVKAKARMFRLMGEQLMRVTQLQYIISVVLFLLYTIILFLQYFNDLTGSMLTGLIFVSVTGLVSFIAKSFPDYWYGIGVFAGSIIAWSFAYMRLRWLERHLDEHTFCRGTLLESKKEPMPDAKVYDLRERRRAEKEAAGGK